ncbi:type VI secretion system protein TssA [Marinobacter sp. NP-4(2019)]|uniref:type VI secretion system protein TssA n=1 Tax=Marinobacter sp. NP-4(2019) TaxID=2488665 RepID=UPI000FC3E69A|nr:type VI secretion system protein TssA [Marinobacter sp. NP-4(2019)]AZT85455.1 type VI secretion system protein TssA [Marinobacter sp. NP-4(2019)]
MQVVEQHPYVEQVLETLGGESDMGESLGDDATLEFLEDEIMKVGSLAHNEVDWNKVESESLRLLSDRSKDLKVLGFLLISLQRGGDGERFALSLFLLHRVLDSWWEHAWPYPGDKGKRARRMMFTQMLQRAGKGVDSLTFDRKVGDGRSYCLGMIDNLIAQAGDRELVDDGIYDLKRAIEKLPADPEPAPAVTTAQPSEKPATSAATTTVNKAPTASLGELTLDPANERATRQSLLKVADLLVESEPDTPLGYQLRRYAIWQGITSVPPSRDGIKTDLAAVSADRVAEYREALEKAPDMELWKRIEQSLSVSPFWLDGHWLSAGAAESLGYGPCAEAIRESVLAFVERLPQLTDMTFNDGTPFLCAEAADWMRTAPVKAGVAGGASPWDQAYEQARELAGQKGLARAMQLMEDGLASAREPRDRFYWRLASARLLKDSGLKALAGQQIQDLHQQTRGLSLEDWEPGLVSKLDKLV